MMTEKQFQHTIDPIEKAIRKVHIDIYSEMEKDLQYLLNSPSTINKLAAYHEITYTVYDRFALYCLMFNDKVIKRYVLEFPEIGFDPQKGAYIK